MPPPPMGTYGVLIDSGVGANASPIAPPWVPRLDSGTFLTLARLSNQIVDSGGAGGSGAYGYWGKSLMGTNQEVWVTWATLGRDVNLFGRLQKPGGASTWTGYELVVGFGLGSGSRYSVTAADRVTNPTLMSGTLTITAGDIYGLQMWANVVSFYQWPFGGGGWVLINQATDTVSALKPQVGYAGIGLDNDLGHPAGALTDFSAGPILNLRTQSYRRR